MISVVIPAYNEEKYLADTLKSIRKQDFDGEYEIIVVDNASTDKTGEIAKEHADAVVYEKQKGVSIARESGWRNVNGEIIAYTDADTIVSRNWLSEVKKGFGKSDIIALYGPVFLSDGGAIKKWMAKYLLTSLLVFNDFIGKPNIIGSNFAVRKAAMEKVDGFDVTLKSAEDVDLALRLKKVGKVVLNRKLVVYASARRFRKGWMKFLVHHTINYVNMFIRGKHAQDMEDIR